MVHRVAHCRCLIRCLINNGSKGNFTLSNLNHAMPWQLKDSLSLRDMVYQWATREQYLTLVIHPLTSACFRHLGRTETRSPTMFATTAASLTSLGGVTEM